MTDEQIIKALKHCSILDTSIDACPGCPLDGVDYCITKLAENAFALIKRQKEECERLESSAKDIDVFTTKTEAIRTLQDRLAVHFGTYTDKDTIHVREVFKLISKLSEKILEE